MVKPSTTSFGGHPCSFSSTVLPQLGLQDLEHLSHMKHEFLHGDSSQFLFSLVISFTFHFRLVHNVSFYVLKSLLDVKYEVARACFLDLTMYELMKVQTLCRYSFIRHNPFRILLRLAQLFGTTTMQLRLRNLLCCGE